VGIFAAIVMGAFLYVGSMWLLPNIITGTTQGEVLIVNILPIALAAVVVGVVVQVFR